VASHRHPKGTYTRDTIDWFSDRLALAGGINTGTLNQYFFSTFSLYNNSNLGESLWVYQVCPCFPGVDFTMGDFYSGTFGSLYGAAHSQISDGPQPAGQLYVHSVVPPNLQTPNPDMPNPIITFQQASGVAGIPTANVRLVIRPGLSMRISSLFASIDTSCTFYYFVMSGTP
jgi:hypothetical protein